MNKYKEILRVVLAISIIVVGVTHLVVQENMSKLCRHNYPTL